VPGVLNSGATEQDGDAPNRKFSRASNWHFKSWI